jgi:hypothetical protein
VAKQAFLPVQLRRMDGDKAVPVTAEVLIGPLVAEVRLNISAEAQLAVRYGKPARISHTLLHTAGQYHLDTVCGMPRSGVVLMRAGCGAVPTTLRWSGLRGPCRSHTMCASASRRIWSRVRLRTS